MSPGRNPTGSSGVGLRIGATVEDNSSRGAGLIVSVLLHAGIIAGTLVTLQHAHLELLAESAPVVPVDLVTIAPKTDISPTITFRPKLNDEQIEPQKLDVTPPKLPPIEQQAEAAPPDQAPSEPVLPKPRPAPTPIEKPKRMVEQPKKKTEEDFSALLNKLTAPTAAPKNAKLASRNIRGFGDQSAMTVDLSDALSSQIARCWNPPIGAPRAN